MIEDTRTWLEGDLGRTIDIEDATEDIRKRMDGLNRPEHNGSILSLSQTCELKDRERVLQLMDSLEKAHIVANSGPSHGWTRAMPLKWKNWTMKPPLWRTAARRRL